MAPFILREPPIASKHSESTSPSESRARARAGRARAGDLERGPPVAVDVANLLFIANVVSGNGAHLTPTYAYFESGRAAEVLLHTPQTPCERAASARASTG